MKIFVVRASRGRRGRSEPPHPDPHQSQHDRDRSLDARRTMTSNGSPHSHVTSHAPRAAVVTSSAEHRTPPSRSRAQNVTSAVVHAPPRTSGEYTQEVYNKRNRKVPETSVPVTSSGYDVVPEHSAITSGGGGGAFIHAPANRSSHQQQRRRLESIVRNDSLSSDPSDCARPPPPKPHKHRKGRSGGHKPSMLSQERLSPTQSFSSEAELQSSECSSCDEHEMESESVSEKGQFNNKTSCFLL